MSYVTGYNTGTPDMLVYKLDASGNKQWRRHYGGMLNDIGRTIQQTADGGYILTGTTSSYVNGPPGDMDMLVYKLDAAGKKQWRKNYGGTNSETGSDIAQTFH